MSFSKEIQFLPSYSSLSGWSGVRPIRLPSDMLVFGGVHGGSETMFRDPQYLGYLKTLSQQDRVRIRSRRSATRAAMSSRTRRMRSMSSMPVPKVHLCPDGGAGLVPAEYTCGVASDLAHQPCGPSATCHRS